MDKLEQIINEKYYWRPEYRLIMDWAEMALNAGTDAVEVASFVARRLFQKAEVKI